MTAYMFAEHTTVSNIYVVPQMKSAIPNSLDNLLVLPPKFQTPLVVFVVSPFRNFCRSDFSNKL